MIDPGHSIHGNFTSVPTRRSSDLLVTITIHGANDVPVLGGVITGSVTEDVGVVAGDLTTGGALTIADVDQGQSSFAAQSSEARRVGNGSCTRHAPGHWTDTAADRKT